MFNKHKMMNDSIRVSDYYLILSLELFPTILEHCFMFYRTSDFRTYSSFLKDEKK